jgi:hypothetical protein
MLGGSEEFSGQSPEVKRLMKAITTDRELVLLHVPTPKLA